MTKLDQQEVVLGLVLTARRKRNSLSAGKDVSGSCKQLFCPLIGKGSLRMKSLQEENSREVENKDYILMSQFKHLDPAMPEVHDFSVI